jgi:hypothetical protein
MYRFSISTVAGKLKNFIIIGSLENRMKSSEEMDEILSFIAEFMKQYLKTKSLLLVGDFYVFWNALKRVWSIDAGIVLRHSMVIWPDSMHTALNAQEALVKHAYYLLRPIWCAAFPDGDFDPFNIRPIRRVAILTMILIAWLDVRVEVLALNARPFLQRDWYLSKVCCGSSRMPSHWL